MPAGQVQLAAKGLQDEYFSGTPQMSFFNTMFYQHTPFFLKAKEIPVNNSRIGFSSSQICEIKRNGDVVKSITIKITLPSMFISGEGLCYPDASTFFEPKFYFLTSDYTVLYTFSAKNSVLYYNTLNQTWLPPFVQINSDKFSFSRPSNEIVYIAFTNTTDALFWGFKNEKTFINGFYIYDFRTMSEVSFLNSGWINSNYPYFRYYKNNAALDIIDSVDLYIGGQLIESVPSEYMKIYNDINIENNQQESIINLIGDRQTPSTSDVEYFIKVPFSSENIPICALTRHTIEVRIQIKDFLGVVDSNAYNVSQFSNSVILGTTTESARGALFDGTYDYILHNNSIKKVFSNLSTKIETNFPVPSGITNMIMSRSNIYLLNKTSLIQYNTLSNTSTNFDIGKSNCYSNTASLLGTPLGLFNYTNQNSIQIITNKSVRSYDFPFSNILSTFSLNDTGYISTGKEIIVQSLITPYITTSNTIVVNLYGTAKQFSATLNSVYYITNTHLITYKNTIFSIVSLLTTSPNTLTSYTDAGGDKIVVFYGTSVSIFSSGSVFTADIGVEVLDCVYNSIFSTPSIIISLKSGGLARYTVSSNKVDLAVNTGTTVYDKLVISSSFIYCYSKTDNKILQVSISSSWPPTVSPTVPVNISGNPFLAIDSTTSRLYYSGSNNDSLFFGNDSTGFVQNTFQNVPLNFSGLSNIFYNGDYIFAFPENGTSTIYRYNTKMNIKLNSAHSYYELLDSSGNPKLIFNGTLNTDGYRIISFPTILDSNIIMYNTLNPFTEQFSYSIYTFDGLITPYNYLFSTVYKSNIYIASNSVVQTFITTAGGSSQFTSTIAPKSIGSAYNGTNTSFVFNNNPSSVNYYTVDLNNNDSLAVTQPTVNPFSKLGTYSSVIQQGNDVYLTPNNHTNISVFSLTTRLVTDYAVPSAVANFTNTACIANSVLYMFPSNAHTNTWAINIQTKTVSNINTSQNDYRSSTYDGKKYIYLTNPTGNIIRFDTSLENFTDFSGYTRSSPPARVNFVSTTISSLGNVYIANTNSIIRTNVATGQVGNLFENFTTIPKISRQTDAANVIYITNSTNLFRFSTNTFTTANLLQTYLLDRTNSSSKTVTDITANGLSNVYISWSDNTLGYFNFSSNDFSGIYNAVPLTGAAPSGTITTSTLLNGNIYTLTNETVSRTNLFTSTSILNIKIQDTLALGATPINNYSTLFTFKSNVYMFPLNGNVIGKYSESVTLTNSSNIDRQRTNVTNITAVTSVNDYIYCASKTSGNLFEYDTTRDFKTLSNFTVYALPNTAANGFSNSWYNSVDNSVYFLPYRSNIIMAYNTGVQSFGNNATAFSRSTMVEPNVVASSIISTSTSALLTDNGYILPVVNGIFQDANKFIDSVQKRNRFRYEVVPGYAYDTMGFVRDWYLNLNGAPRGPSTIGTTNVLLPGQYEPFKVTAYLYIREPGVWTVQTRMGFGSIVWISKLLNQTDLNESALTYFNADINDTKFFRVYIDLSSFIAVDVNNNRVSGINIEYLYVTSLSQVISIFPTLVPTTIIRAGPFNNIVNILNKDTVTLTLNAQDRLEFRIGTAAGYSPSGLSYVVSGMRSLNFSVDAFSVTESGVPSISEPIGLFFDRGAGGNKDITFPQAGMYRYIAFLGSGSPGNQDKSGLAYAKKSDGVYYLDTYYSDPGDWRNLPPASNIFVDYTQNPSLYYFDLSPIIPVINNGYIANFDASAITKINNDGTFDSSYSPILRDGNANFNKFVVTPNNIYFYDNRQVLFYDGEFYGWYNPISIYNIQSKTSDWFKALVTNSIGPGTNYNAYQICYFNGLLYCLTGTDSITKMFLVQDGGYVAVQNDIIAPHDNVYSSNVSFSLDDGVCFVQSGPLGSNINGINSQSCISYDYVLRGAASSPQQYSCVISVNNLNYLSPSNGSVIIRINTRSTLNIDVTESISKFDISTISQVGAGTYTLYGSSDLLSNVIYSAVNKSSGATHVIKYDTTQDFTIGSSWTYYALMPTITSQTAVYNSSSKRLLVPSSTNNSLIQQPVAVSTVNPYKQTVYNIPSILSNICQVYNSVAYMYPGIGAPTNTIVSYNFNSSSFSYTPHDAVVYDFIIIEPNYHILINQNKINIFSASDFTSLGNFSFPNSSGTINGKAYDGRYLNIFTGSGTVQFDFSEGLNKLSRPITNGVSNIFYSAVNLDGNLYASNNIVYTRLGYQPRGYYEISSSASGLITQSNNVYAKVGSTIVVYNSNLRSATQLITTLSSRPAIDSVFVNSNLVFLTTDYVSSYNVFTRTTQFNTLKNDEYASELLVDNSNIFVPSVTNLNLIRVTNTGSLTIATGSDIIENPTGTRFVNSYYENSNLVMTTDQNILYTYNRFRPSFYNTTMGYSNVYHSTLLNNKIYYFPGSNAVSNVVMVYDTTKPFISNSSYSNIFVDLADIRSSVTVGNSIRGIGYNSNSIYIIDTLNNVLTSKIFIDSTQNMSSNNYLYPIYDRKSYILTPANSTATTLRRIYEVPFLSKSSFGTPILLNDQFSINGLVQTGSTLYVIASNVFSMDLNSPPPNILSATTPLYSSQSRITASLFDGRFLKLITNRVVYYDTLPLTIPQTLLISCIVNYAYLTRREQAWLQKNTLDYIVTQIQRSSIVLNKTKGYYKLNFTGPTKEFMFTLSRGSLNFVELFINGHSKSKLESSYISDINNYIYHKRSPTSTNVYTYSLCLDPLSNKSSGYLNASRVAEQIMYIDVTSLANLSVWALSHNILRIRDGLGGIMFNARDR